MSTPSSSIVRLPGGIDPGVRPPTSAWWAREATKNSGSAEGAMGPAKGPVDVADPAGAAAGNTGVTTVRSGRWVPPA